MIDVASWGWPQVVLLVLYAFEFSAQVMLHGKPRTPHSIANALFGAAIIFPLLLFGGFFG